MKQYRVAILGATGEVGREMMKILEERQFPIAELKLLASARSAGKKLSFAGKDLTVEEASEHSFAGMDIVLGAASADLASVASRLEKGEGTLGKLSADAKLYDEVTARVKDIRQVVDNYRDTTPISSFGSLIGGAL